MIAMAAVLLYIAINLVPTQPEPMTGLRQSLKEIHVKKASLDDHKCDSSEWHFVINQIDSEGNAPDSIIVESEGGITEVVDRFDFRGGVAHYTTTSNLNQPVADAWTLIYDEWEGEFNLSHGPCLDPTNTPEPTGTPIPTDTPEPTETPGTGTPGATPNPTETPIPTDTPPEPTGTPIPSETPGEGTPSATPAPTDTPVPTDTPTIDPTNTPVPPTDEPGPQTNPPGGMGPIAIGAVVTLAFLATVAFMIGAVRFFKRE